MRRDFFDPLLAEPRLSRVLGRSEIVVHPLPTSAWLEVLDQALARYGDAFEDGAMRDAMANELRQMSDAMPLVQFALAKLWQARDRERRVITARAPAEAGGLAGALDQHAEGVVAALVGRHGPAAVEALRAVTASLTTAQGTRATATPAQISERARPPLAEVALRALAQARLVTVEAGRATLSHDALVTAWERLRRWTAAAQKEHELADEVERQAAAWRKRPSHELLWRGVQLQEARALVSGRRVQLGDDALRFVAASHRFALRAVLAGAGLVVALACAGGLVWKLYADTRAQHRQDAADVSTLLEQAATRADRSHELSLRIRELERQVAACHTLPARPGRLVRPALTPARAGGPPRKVVVAVGPRVGVTFREVQRGRSLMPHSPPLLL